MSNKYWCMGCGAYGEGPCEMLGHISRAMKREHPDSKVWVATSKTTIATEYLGKLTHLKVVLP